MSALAPGPWWADGYKVKGIDHGRTYVIASTANDNFTNEAQEGHARLISAAPELLAACQAWDQDFPVGESYDYDQFFGWFNQRRAMARAAIAMATTP